MWRHHRSELRPPHSLNTVSRGKEMSVMFWQDTISYAMCHINLVNAVISVIVALGFSPNQRRLMLFKSWFWQLPGIESIHILIGKRMFVVLWQDNDSYVMCHINLVIAVISVIVALGFSPTQQLKLFNHDSDNTCSCDWIPPYFDKGLLDF